MADQQDNLKDFQENEDIYKMLKYSMEDLKTLQKYLIEFRNIFEVIPNPLTSETASKFHTNYLDKYSIFYVWRKKSIVRATIKATVSFGKVYKGDPDLKKFLDLFKEISDYFTNFLPAQYVDSIFMKLIIADNVNTYVRKLQEAVNRVISLLETLRGETGTGNDMLDSFITNTLEIANAPMNKRRIDQTNLDQVVEEGRIRMAAVKAVVRDFESMVGAGIDRMTDEVAQRVRHFLARASNNKVMNYIKGPDVYSEDHVREIVRRKYGNDIPFCDEVTITDANNHISFVKESEWDPKAKKKIVDMQARAAWVKARISNSPFN